LADGRRGADRDHPVPPRAHPIFYLRAIRNATEFHKMTDCWIDDFGMIQCPRCEQVFPVDAHIVVAPVTTSKSRTQLRITCPSCANVCRVEPDVLAIGMH
jgi:uncharacterized C2H2 Zn-finger protein